jgi:hypothetical protein
LMQIGCSSKSANFQICQNHKWNNTHTCILHYSAVTHATALFQTGNESAKCLLSTSSCRSSR